MSDQKFAVSSQKSLRIKVSFLSDVIHEESFSTDHSSSFLCVWVVLLDISFPS